MLIWVWRILVTVVLALCVGCSGDADDSAQAGGVPPPPEVGDCWNTPAENLGVKDLVDDSPLVDCSEPHTLQTVNVIETEEEMTPELIEQLAKYCEAESVFGWFASPGRGAYNVAYFFTYGPTPEQAEAGQSWVRCDAGIQAETHCCRPLAAQTESMEGAMGTDLARFQQCISQVPDPKRSQPLVPCKEPHQAELMLTIMDLDASEYPSTAKLDKTGQEMCGELVVERDDADALVLMPFWQSEEEAQGGTIHGGCWIRRKAGLLPGL
jgi:Septum formation